MRKVPTLFQRDPDDRERLTRTVHPDALWVLALVRPAPPALDLSEDEADADAVIQRLGDLLDRIAVAVKGPPPPLTSWSYHDLPELVEAAVKRSAPPALGGVTLTVEEVDRIVGALRWIEEFAPVNVRLNSRAGQIAARLEGASS